MRLVQVLALPLIALPALFACTAPEPDPDPDPTPVVADHDCGEAWGPAIPGDRLFVDPSATEGGDGSLGSPFSSLSAASSAAAAAGVLSIAMTDGELPADLTLAVASRAGTELVGCGEGQTVLTPETPTDPVLTVSGDADGVHIHQLSIEGGRRAILVFGGVGEDDPVLIEQVTLDQPVRVGVLIDGEGTTAHLTEVTVLGVVQEEELGWGIAIQTGLLPGEELMPPAPVVLDGVLVDGAAGVGILADGAWVDFSDVTVTDVTSVGAELGRGLQMQNLAYGDITGLISTGNSDAAVYLHKPGRNGEPVVLVDSTLGSTAAAEGPGGELTGDGLAISQGGDLVSPEDFEVVVDDVTIAANTRVAILVEDASLVLEAGNNLTGKGTGFPVIAGQGGALIDAAADVAGLVEMLAPGDELGMLSAPLEPDDPSDVL